MQIFNDRQPESPFYLSVMDSSGTASAIPLEANQSLFVGSGNSCAVVLEDRQVELIHCMFWMSGDNVLRIQDWNTEGRTVVNGQPVSEELVINSGDRISLGNCEIVAVLSEEVHRLESNKFVMQQIRQSVVIEDVEADSKPAAASAEHQPEMTASFESGNAVTESDLDDVFEEDQSTDSWEQLYSVDDSEKDGYGDPYGLSPNHDAVDSFDSVANIDELEQLQQEVEQLRFEIAERDNRIAEMETHSEVESFYEPESNALPEQDSFDDDPSIQIANRLEELIDELQSSDDRIRTLEDLLEASDQAAQAEKDEREQLESWINEIEQRVSIREQETQAELNRVKKKLAESQREVNQAKVRMRKLTESQSQGAPRTDGAVANELQSEIAGLQNRIALLEKENDELQKEKESNPIDETRARLRQTEKKLMEMEVETARERAEMSRQRAEIARMKDELEEKLTNAKVMGKGDSRIQAMRQHLRALHEEEKIAAAIKKQKGLGNRIAKLLSRV